MKEKVYKYLSKLNIPYEIVNHPALYTVADNDKYGVEFDGLICKNLFLRNKNKSRYYLVSMPINKSISLRDLTKLLAESKLSFANEDDLLEKLKIKSGAVSILNAVELNNTDITFILAKDLLIEEKVGFHPNDNTVTVFFKGEMIETILQNLNIQYHFIDL